MLALVAGTVFLAQLFDTGSMVSAITRVEEKRIFSPPDDDAATGRVSRAPTWDNIRTAHNAALRSHSLVRRHEGLARLLFLLASVKRGEQDPLSAFAVARPLAEADPDNLVARLALAVIADMGAFHDPEAAPSPDERFARVREIVEGARPVREATLHNAEFSETWHGVVRGFVTRPDVAVSLAEAMPGYLIESQYEVLPIIRDRLVALAAALEEIGHKQAADQCDAWFARLSLGLIEADPDTGTRLLCAELLAETLDKGTPGGDGADGLRRLIRDYRAVASAAPIDMAEQSFYSRPAVDPDAYRGALFSLVGACVFGLASAGGAVVFVVACLVAGCGAIVARGKDFHHQTVPGQQHHTVPGQRKRGRSDSPSTAGITPGGRPASQVGHGLSERRRPLYALLLVGLIPATVVATVVIRWLASRGLHSEFWGYFAASCAVAVGALWVMALALWMTSSTARTRWRVVVCGLFAVAAMLAVLLPPPVVTRICRSFDLWGGVVWLLIPGVVLPVAAALVLCPARFRTIALAASLFWCSNSVVALTLLQFHGAADKRYQQSVLHGRRDEIAARLGADWQATYLSAAREAVRAGGS